MERQSNGDNETINCRADKKPFLMSFCICESNTIPLNASGEYYNIVENIRNRNEREMRTER
jgi:hypothetical protein